MNESKLIPLGKLNESIEEIREISSVNKKKFFYQSFTDTNRSPLTKAD